MILGSRSVELRYKVEEPRPLTAGCSIHPWERSYVLLRDNPYMAKTNANGQFTIKHLPHGKHLFRFWHEDVGWLQDLTFAPHMKKGQYTIEVSKTKLDFGTIKLAPKIFKSQSNQPKD